MDSIKIGFAIRGKYTAHLATAIQSIFSSNPDEQFEIFVLACEVPPGDLEKLSEIFQGRQSNLHLIPVEIKPFENLPVIYHLDIATYLRLLIPMYVSGPKVIYLDSDLVVNGPIRPLWETQLDDYYFACVPDFCGNVNPHFPVDPKFGYVNAGVMLMNLKQWRLNDLSQKVLEYVQTNPKMIRFADQCGLNAVSSGHFLPLNPKFNFQGIFFDSGYRKPKIFSEQEMILARKNPVIIHFVGSKKPWHWGCKHPDRGLYWKYLKLTPYKRRFPENPTPLNVLRNIAPKSWIEYFYSLKNKLKIKGILGR